MSRLRAVLFLSGGLLVGLVAGGLLLYNRAGNFIAAQKPPPPATGAEMADFALEGLNGKQYRLSDLRGKPVVLNFWATWCPPCRVEMPLFEGYSKKYKDQVTIIGVNYAEDRATVQNFIEDRKISFPIWLDPAGKVSDLYYVQSYPNTFFIDEEGVLRGQHIGQLDEALMDRYLEALGILP